MVINNCNHKKGFVCTRNISIAAWCCSNSRHSKKIEVQKLRRMLPLHHYGHNRYCINLLSPSLIENAGFNTAFGFLSRRCHACSYCEQRTHPKS
jgi:hypothetical protein